MPRDHEGERSEPYVEKRVSENNRRKGGMHCPICVQPLQKNRRRTKALDFCNQCQAHPTQKYCRRCAQPLIWENKSGAACQGCGHHGAKRNVIASRP